LGLGFESAEKKKCKLVLTNFCYDSGQDDLGLSGRLDGGAEIGIIPCVDFALAVDEWGSGMHLFGQIQVLSLK